MTVENLFVNISGLTLPLRHVLMRIMRLFPQMLSKNRLTIIAVLLIVLVGGFFVPQYWQSREPIETVKKLQEALRNKDDAQIKELSAEEFPGLLRNEETLAQDIVDSKMDGYKRGDDNDYLVYILRKGTLSTGHSYTEGQALHLKKIGGAWKVTGRGCHVRREDCKKFGF